jgi:hypothetical protein
MSWEIFKQNILRVANSPEGISDINVIAELYAKEYDAAVKRGFDRQHSIPLITGNVEVMKQLFISALQKGVNSSTPYDLVGEMGAGVKAYWAGAVMATAPLPIKPAIQATVNLSVTQNIVTDPGIWQQPISSPSVDDNTELTPEQRIEYQESLESELEKYNKFVEQGRKPEEFGTVSDAIAKFTSILNENKDYNTEVPLQDALLGRVPGQLDVAIKTQITEVKPVTTPTPEPKVDLGNFELNSTQPLTSTTPTDKAVVPEIISAEKSNSIDTKEKVDLGYFELDSGQSINVSESDDEFGEIKFNQGKPFVSGFKIGGSGGPGGYNGSYIPFNNFAGNSTVGEKAVQVALHDVSQNVIENPDDSGHPRIAQMHKLGGARDGDPWCACAVTTWWIEAGYVFNGHANKAYCPTWEAWSIANGSWVDMTNPANANFIPKPGDAIIYDWAGANGAANHIGLFWKYENSKWWGIDGNKGAKGQAKVAAHCIQSLGAVRGVIRI